MWRLRMRDCEEEIIKVLFATPQCNPFAGAGGLAPIPRELGSKLIQLPYSPKIDFKLVIPYYSGCTRCDYKGFSDLNPPLSFETRVKDQNGDPYKVSIKKTELESLVEPGKTFTVYAVCPEDTDLFNGDEIFYTIPGPGGNPSSQQLQLANQEALKFAVFSNAVVEMLRQPCWRKAENWFPDIIHCQDWQTGLIPVYLKAHPNYKDPEGWEGGKKPKTFFTFHYAPRTEAQGVFNKTNAGWTPDELLRKCCWANGENEDIYQNKDPDPNIHHYCDSNAWKGQNPNWSPFNSSVSFVKGGFCFSDLASTVSENYAFNELPNIPWSEGNEKVLKELIAQGRWDGVMNGILYEEYEPLIDPNLVSRFTFLSYGDPRLQSVTLREPNFVQDKPPNKAEFREWLHERLWKMSTGVIKPGIDDGNLMRFDLREEHFLAVLPARIAWQKGIDIALEGIKTLFNSSECDKLRVIVMGTGDYQDALRRIKGLLRVHPDKFLFINWYNNAWERMLIAAGDLYLMPSRFEPCGIGQLRGHHYGCVVLGSKVGGIVDSVTHVEKWNGDEPIAPANAAYPEPDGYLFDLDYPANPGTVQFNRAVNGFLYQLKRAYNDFYNLPGGWRRLVYNAMIRNHSWDQSAERYRELYKRLAEDP
jgi:starch synthase